MAAREPFKPISIDKRLGEVYFHEKCYLTGFGSAPKTDPFSIVQAEAMVKKNGNNKKPIKVKVTALADSLKLVKASHIGKKPPHSKIKYSEVKLHKIFPHSKKVLVLGIQVSGSPQQYLVLTFEQPLKATRLDDELTYADDAPRHNLKYQIPVFEPPEVNEPSPTYNITNSPAFVNATGSVSEPTSGSRETTPIHENEVPQARFNPPAEVSGDLSTSGVVGLPRQPAHSPSLSPSPPSSPTPTQSDAHTPQSIPYDHSQIETLNEPANPKEVNAPVCVKCRSECKNLVSTATSPVKMPTNKSRSISSSRSHSYTYSDSSSQLRSPTCSCDKYPRIGRFDSRTSTASRRTMTTDASSHYVVYEERPLYEHRIRSQQQQKPKSSPVSKSTFSVRDKGSTQKTKPRPRTVSTSSSISSASSFSSTSRRQSRSKREHRPKTLVSSRRVDHHQLNDDSKAASGSSRSLFILATGKFKPFSELSHEHNGKTQGICSICGEVGVGDPRQVEIIRTDSSGGPVISDDGTIYMYSTTRPAEYTNDDELHRKNKSHHSDPRHCSLGKSRSSSSSCSSKNDIELPVVTPVSVKRQSTPTSTSLTEVYVPNESKQRSHHESPKKKRIYRLDSSDSDSSSSSSDENKMSHLGSIKVMPLRY
ncbi:expressed conserved protein [Echinococcus multilocularis]|uniref:Expressed conserved protein n=1 Tax=Echinococcus multilocularis TaxID=6211 RepID=A0A068YFR0_ECHMU|nr:expressed conserved protein [Echinococcus multilocularis]